MAIRFYGTSDDKKMLLESQQSREIVKNIMDLGPTQNQILYIIHDLAMNLEDLNQVNRIIEATKKSAEELIIVSTDGPIEVK